MNHPSRLALDRHALGETSAGLDAHLAGCSECRAHIEATRQPLPVPRWVADASATRSCWRGWRRAAVAVAAAVSAAGLVFFLPHPPPSTTAKGQPTVTVWLKRGDAVSAWDGKSPVRGGDAIRLEAMPAGYAYLTVVFAAGGGLTTLFAAKVDPSGKPTLTPAWSLDGEGRQEHLAVLFTRAPVDDASLDELLSRRDAQAWSIHEILPKESP